MNSIRRWRRAEIAIDFGTANVRIIRPAEGVVFDEPSLCCFSHTHGHSSFVAAGEEAHQMADRVPVGYRMMRPLSRGVLQDIDAARAMLRHALSIALPRRGYRTPGAIIGVPVDATQAERSALLTAANDAGIGPVRLVAEPLAAAVGANLPVAEAHGSMIIECGAGTTEVAIFSLGGMCATGTVRIGGRTLDKAIADHLHLNHKFLIGSKTAERVKTDYVTIREQTVPEAPAQVSASGRCLLRGLPRALDISVDELDLVVEGHVSQIVTCVLDVLSRVPPELSYDICDSGLVLTGGGALTPLMRTMVAKATGLDVRVAHDPSRCVARGLREMLVA